MSDDIRKETRKQYFRYFRIWFILVGILGLITVLLAIRHFSTTTSERENNHAPKERVYDLANLLTDGEEEELRSYIAKKEAEYEVDLVVVTFSEELLKEEDVDNDALWKHTMMDYADAFWDSNGYGYNKDVEGDGAILIDNRYDGQRGEWLSTSGKVERALSEYDIEDVLFAVDEYYDSNPFRAYISYVDEVCKKLGGIHFDAGYYLGGLLVTALIAFAYAQLHLRKNNAKDTTRSNTYLVGGKPDIQGDDLLLRKNVVKRHISTGSGGHSGSGGGGGHHTSHSGASHGGGGHRH